ncbi:MAG: hypothetical protein K8R25_11880 [Methanosarcinales archaeon]|nr:hypothetical protein [Methanosarcinales archaeon]
MSDGVYQGNIKRIDDLPIMVASDCIDFPTFFPKPFHSTSSIFLKCGSAIIIRK